MCQVLFSVRFCGQEVADIRVGTEPFLVIREKHQRATQKYFKLTTEPGAWKWDSPQAREFRAKFRALGNDQRATLSGRSEEHAVESRILLEMEKGGSKFGGQLNGIRHVGLTKREYPFQCPTPISASTGSAKKTPGHIDILSRRRGAGGRTRLSVWELKRPGQFQHALDQVYVYTVTLALMLRGNGGIDWYRVFGFTAPLPKQLELEAVVAVTPDQRSKLERAAKRLIETNDLVLSPENAKISLHAAYYDPRSLAIHFENL